MHRRMRDRLEETLAGSLDRPEAEHLEQCAECRDEIAAMRQQSAWLRALKAAAEVEPRAGFYARVMERIENQGAASIWTLFLDSAFGRSVAVGAMALALLLGVYVVSSEETSEQTIVITGQPVISDQILGSAGPYDAQPAAVLAGQPDIADSVLMNLVTYQEQ